MNLEVFISETLSSVQFNFSSDQIIEWSFELSKVDEDQVNQEDLKSIHILITVMFISEMWGLMNTMKKSIPRTLRTGRTPRIVRTIRNQGSCNAH